ncbi:MAG TPA: hypothetical protein VIF12_07110 [Micavibrio sp.]|jgi:hypothetical protein
MTKPHKEDGNQEKPASLQSVFGLAALVPVAMAVATTTAEAILSSAANQAGLAVIAAGAVGSIRLADIASERGLSRAATYMASGIGILSVIAGTMLSASAPLIASAFFLSAYAGAFALGNKTSSDADEAGRDKDKTVRKDVITGTLIGAGVSAVLAFFLASQQAASLPPPPSVPASPASRSEAEIPGAVGNMTIGGYDFRVPAAA